MGCDIHLHVEIKLNDVWLHYAAPSIARSYRLFEKMAGVRGVKDNAIVPPKGIPEDITLITKLSLEDWSDDAHSRSWLNKQEIDILESWLEDYIWYSILNTDKPRFNIQDIRFVFWFDN